MLPFPSKQMILNWIALIPLIIGSLCAEEVVIENSEGEVILLDINPEESIRSIESLAQGCFQEKCTSITIEFPARNQPLKELIRKASRSQGGYLGHPRNYSIEVSPEEKSDIRYIVTSLANKSLISIAFIKGDLESAGDRIDHLHPLRFLMTVFTDEELKVGIRNIRGKGWVWSHFTGGLKDCLSTEFSIGNMREDQILHFAQTVGIDPNVIFPSIYQKNWDELIDLLITHIPRKGDHNRYDC